MLTARSSNSQMGKPLKADMQVPRYARQTYNHRIAWSRNSRLSFEYYNSAVDIIGEKPCWRRYLEYIGSFRTSIYQYIPNYTPPPLIPKPERFWTLVIAGTPTSCFTNVCEAWLVMQGLNKFGNIYDTHLIYTDRTV